MASPTPPQVAPSGRYDSPTDEQENKLQEGIEEELPELSLDITDEELASNIDSALQMELGNHQSLKAVRELNEAYWLGNQLRPEETTTKKVRPIENRQFISTETLIPIATMKPSEPVVFGDPTEKEDLQKLERVLQGLHQDDELEITLATVVRHWFLNRIGVMKVVLDAETKNFATTFVRPQRLVIPSRGVTVDELPYIAELVDGTYDDLITNYPDKKKEILEYLTTNNKTEPTRNTPVKWWEFWANDFFACKLGPVILVKAKNPLYDFEDVNNNFLLKPQKPYFLLHRILSLGKQAIDDTTYAEQTKALQDGVNKNNWNTMEDLSDRGLLIGSGDGISSEELSKYRGEANEKLWIEKGDPSAVIARLEPKTINNLNLLQKRDMADQIDNIYGTHGTTRGERGPSETATGRTLLKEQDVGRTSPLTKAIDAMLRRLYNMDVQIMKLYWDEEHFVDYVDQSGEGETMSFSAQNIPAKARIRVKPGSSLPEDKYVQRNEAMELNNSGSISKIDLYDRLGWPKPIEAAKRAEIQAKIDKGELPPDALYPGFDAEIKKKIAESAAQSGIPLPGSGTVPTAAAPGTMPPANVPPVVAPPANVPQAAANLNLNA